MKKSAKIITAILLVAAVCAFTLTACASDVNGGAAISREQAQKIATAIVDVNNGNLEFSAVSRDATGNYLIELVVDGVKYEVKVDSTSGSVTKIEINDQAVSVNDVPTAPSSEKATATGYIGLEAAKTAAIQDAGVADAAAVVFTEAHFDFDDGKYLYEVEFTYENVEYEYDVDAKSGAVYKKEVNNVTVVAPTPPTGETYIGVDAAKAAALTDSGVAAEEATFKKAVLDRDNGVRVYEVEFTAAGGSYEYEINAVTGVVISKEIEGAAVPSPSDGTTIGLDEAKRIATAHAGVSDAVFADANLEVDKGVSVYEIEFTSGNYEYEYEINAANGSIINAERELND